MATHADLAVASESLQRDVTASVDLSHALRDAVQDPELTVSAKGAHTLAATATHGTNQGLGSWVDVADIHHNRDVSPPPPVRQSLITRTEAVTAAAATAGSVGAFLNYRAMPLPSGNILPGRVPQDRTPPTAANDAPGIGCER